MCCRSKLQNGLGRRRTRLRQETTWCQRAINQALLCDRDVEYSLESD